MKTGTTIFLLMIILIAFGFVISEYRQIRDKLTTALFENEELTLQILQNDQKLKDCMEKNQESQAILIRKENEITMLHKIIAELKNQIAKLLTENAQLRESIKFEEKNELGKLNSKQQTVMVPNNWIEANPIILAVIIAAQLVFSMSQIFKKK